MRKHPRPDDLTARARSFFVKTQDLWDGLEHMKGHVSMPHALLDTWVFCDCVEGCLPLFRMISMRLRVFSGDMKQLFASMRDWRAASWVSHQDF